MHIIDLYDDAEITKQTAALLIEGFKELSPQSWPDMETAVTEVRESLAENKISRVAIDDDGLVLGWIAGERTYNDHAWELHPLVVHPTYQGQGIGRQLVLDLEAHVKARDGITIYLGTDDEDNRTSLGGVDLYPNVLEHLANIRNLHRHPYEFYQKLDYTIVGVIPDANGPGKPDIYMAKRVRNMKEDNSSRRKTMDPKRQMLRHFLASLAYRTQKALRDAPEGSAAFRVAPGVRTPHEIVKHMTSVLGYARTFFIGGEWWPEMLEKFDDEVLRFHDILESLNQHLEEGEFLQDMTPERMLQGPFSDAMSHAGQLSMLRRLFG